MTFIDFVVATLADLRNTQRTAHLIRMEYQVLIHTERTSRTLIIPVYDSS